MPFSLTCTVTCGCKNLLSVSPRLSVQHEEQAEVGLNSEVAHSEVIEAARGPRGRLDPFGKVVTQAAFMEEAPVAAVRDPQSVRTVGSLPRGGQAQLPSREPRSAPHAAALSDHRKGGCAMHALHPVPGTGAAPDGGSRIDGAARSGKGLTALVSL